jgi:PAS domain S-box-containing protein
VAAGIRSVLGGRNKSFSIEYTCEAPGEQQWFLVTVTPLPGERPTGAVVMHLNITAQMRAKRRLLESEEEYRVLFDSNPHPMWVFDVETLAFLAVNDAAVRLYGYSRDEFLGMTIKEIRPLGEVPALLEYLDTIPDSPSLPATQVKHRKRTARCWRCKAAPTRSSSTARARAW